MRKTMFFGLSFIKPLHMELHSSPKSGLLHLYNTSFFFSFFFFKKLYICSPLFSFSLLQLVRPKKKATENAKSSVLKTFPQWKTFFFDCYKAITDKTPSMNVK